MKVYYTNLNTVRFIAASFVVIHHIEQFKFLDNLPNHFLNSFVLLMGKLGVDIFFVLSGFLITSLLVEEKQEYQNIAVGKFYVRRILRIWPLYFLLILLAYFIIPHIPEFKIHAWDISPKSFWPSLLLMIFFLPNVQSTIFNFIPYSAQLWSIGVEEQFYLCWPLVVKRTKNTAQLKRTLIIILIGYIALKIIIKILSNHLPQPGVITTIDFFLTDRFQVDCLLIGGLFSIFNKEEKTKRLLTSKTFQIIVYVATLFLMLSRLRFDNFFWTIYAVLFACIIINLVNYKSSLINLEYPPLNYLGKISYGIYMFHPVIIVCTIRFITHNSILVYLVSFILTILISALSYEYFERFFLSRKRRFAMTESGK